MSLIKSRSKKAFKENVRREIKAGRSKKQALTIVYSVKQKSRRSKWILNDLAE